MVLDETIAEEPEELRPAYTDLYRYSTSAVPEKLRKV